MKEELRAKARLLRRQGAALNEIAGVLSVSKSSVSLWVRDIQLSQEQKAGLELQRRQYAGRNAGAQANRERSRKLRVSYQNSGRARARENRPLHLAGCMRYWAEGAKGKNGIYFVNSDHNMVVMFMRFLREELDVKDAEIAVRIHCHTSDLDEQRHIENYWLKVLGLSLSCFRKTYVKQGSDSRRKILMNGVCDIRVHRTDLIQHIYGAIQEYGGFDNAVWLF